ncbi:class F sortase [Bacillus infantis]|uniref:class F sortase n=1 Tax=Bacillus infantis TaxID=324767 RepID=UPI001CD54999|nr:class F sortase [Bacillus infantis]MCA1038236.1 class F sortase [Bacillus infantis]
MKKPAVLLAGSLICFIIGGFSNKDSNELEDPPIIKQKQEQSIKKAEIKEEFHIVEKKAETKEIKDLKGIVPVSLKIPSLGIEAPVGKVGILENGAMGVPDDNETAGWFEPGIKPGEKGSSVIAGHVDSKAGPAVFFYLKDLAKGDTVIVTAQDGLSYTFEVQELKSYPYDRAPISDVFGPSDERRLNLITCTGTYNREKNTHEERLVVYTVLKSGQEDRAETFVEPPAPDHVKISGGLLTWHAVRSGDISGYRIYSSTENGDFFHAASISSHERKSLVIDNEEATSFYITAVSSSGNESKPSEIITK